MGFATAKCLLFAQIMDIAYQLSVFEDMKTFFMNLK